MKGPIGREVAFDQVAPCKRRRLRPVKNGGDDIRREVVEPEHAILISGYDELTNNAGQRVRLVILNDPLVYSPGQGPYHPAGGYVVQPSGKVVIPWENLRNRLNLTSAIFLSS